MTICQQCKTEIREGEKKVILSWAGGDERGQHLNCIATLRDRAETAEAELAEATETNEENSRISEENSRFIDDIIDALGYTIRGDEAFLDEIVDLAAALRAELDALKAENHSAHARAAGADAAIDQFTDLMFGEGWEDE